jgi:hypothetical protein
MSIRKNKIVCPNCEHEFSNDDMQEFDVDLYAIAPNEGLEDLVCPCCSVNFFVSGTYTPIYTTALSRDELD